MKNYNYIFAYVMSICLLNGCIQKYEPQPVRPSLPHEWKGISTAQLKNASEEEYRENTPWWFKIDDPYLHLLIEEGLKNNPTLKIRLYRLKEAQHIAAGKGAPLFPQGEINAGYSSFRKQTQNSLSKNPIIVGGAPITTGPPIIQTQSTQVQILPQLSYELDVWGKIQQERDAALEDAHALSEEWKSLEISFSTQIASSYFNIRFKDQQIHFLEEIIHLRQEEMALNEALFSSGLSNQIDFNRSQVDLSYSEILLQQARLERIQYENLLANLIGKPSSEFVLSPSKKSLKLPENIPSIFCYELAYRHDMLQAYHQAESARYSVGATKAACLPSFEITGQWGWQNKRASHLLEWKNRIWSINPTVNIPLFSGGKNTHAVKAAVAYYQQALYNYIQTTLNAVQEVEDSLASLHQTQDKRRSSSKAVDAAFLLKEAGESRYNAGLDSYLSLANARRTLLNAQLDKVQTENDYMQAYLILVKSIGR